MASLFIIQGDKSIHPLFRKLPGLLFIALMTVGFLQLAALPSVARMGLGSLTLAMVGGALLGNTLSPPCNATVMRVLIGQNTICCV